MISFFIIKSDKNDLINYPFYLNQQIVIVNYQSQVVEYFWIFYVLSIYLLNDTCIDFSML